jgi:hypothetical protein
MVQRQTYLEKARLETQKMQHIQRLLLFPPEPHQDGDTELLTAQIKEHIRLYKRFTTLAAKQQQQINNTLFL